MKFAQAVAAAGVRRDPEPDHRGKLSAEGQTNVELAMCERFTEWAFMLPDIVAAMNEGNEQTPADLNP